MKTLLLLIALCTVSYSQTPKPTPPPVPVADADAKKISAIVTDLQKLQASIELLQARLEAAIATAMARQKLSPDEYDIISLDGGQYGFRPKPPQTTASKPVAPQ